MTLRVYNTSSRLLEEFIPLAEGKVGMYVCGPTTYDLCHMGHARAYVAFDMIRRYLEYSGFEVKYVQNFTDVDDKIINRSGEKGMPPLEFARIYIEEYFKDMDMLGIKRADHHPLASENIDEMIELVKGLVERGFAYNVKGNVYFSIYKALDKVGQLTHQPLDEMLDGARVEINPEKDHPKDFALWKRAKEGEIWWESPWGKGRPGWHIECSTMSMRYIGETLDIHGGGQDLIFPHHESEILQSECFTGKKFTRYWLHNGFVRINEEKMSKSLGNFFTIREVLRKYSPAVVRFFFMYTHYRQPIDYSDDHLEEAKRSLERIRTSIANAGRYLRENPDTGMADEKTNLEDDGKTTVSDPGDELVREADRTVESFRAAMDDDFNTRKAMAEIFQLTHEINRGIGQKRPKDAVGYAHSVLRELLAVLGLPPEMILDSRSLEEGSASSAREDELIRFLVDLRDEMRKEKLWRLADLVRDRLRELGIIIEDTRGGTVISGRE